MNYIKTDDNIKIAINDMAPYNNKTIIFVHGWPLDSRIFEYQYNILPTYGYRCISIDLRGFGDSDKPYDGYDYNTLAKDLYNLINKIEGGNITLVGFSMGGAIATRYMANYNGYKINKLALLGAALPSFTNQYGKTKEEVNKLINNIMIDRPQTITNFGKNFFNSNISKEFRDHFNTIALSQCSYSTIKTALSLRDEDLTEDLKQIKTKTAIFHGLHDKICPYELAIQTNKLITNSKLYTFEYSGHAVYYDELEKFNKTFLEFLKE